MNAQLAEDSISVFATINLGIAIALSDGLVVANLPSAEGKSLLELDEQILQTTERVRSQKFTEEDLTGSTFTISNLGQYGIRTFAAVIHPPEAAILALGRCEQRVVVVAGRIEIRWVMSVTLSCDHRIIDGATAGLFLNCLSEAIKHYA
jgi:pyruvate dehydrogenase E2 component (dihydrolipoamide acetyltransferase)